MVEVMSKLDEVIDIIDNSETIKALKKLKKTMDTDDEIKELLKDFALAKEKYEHHLITIKDFSASKEKLYSHQLVTEYRHLFGKINLSFQKFNKQIMNLINKKSSCNRI